MDTLDLKILRELMRNNIMPFPSPVLRKSFRSIGRNLGVDQGTVRNRIRLFRQNGFVNEFYLGVNPSLFGCRIAALWFDVHPESEKEHLRKEVSTMKNTLLVCDYLGSKMSAVFCYGSEKDLKEITRKITRMANSEEVLCQNKQFLPCRLNLAPSDWRIIASLQRGDPQKSFDAIARETRLSTKTVKKRISAMVEDGAIYQLANVNLRSFENFVPTDVTVFYQSPEFKDSVSEALKSSLRQWIVFADVDSEHCYLALALPSIARIREIENGIKRIEGVGRIQVEILQDILSLKQFYVDQVRAKVEPSIKVLAH